MSHPPLPARWEHFEHGADIGVRGLAPTRAGAFEQAALALTAVIADPAGVQAREAVPIRCAAPDAELLLLDWLNALVSAMALRRMLFGRFTVTITPSAGPGEGPGGLALEGVARGEPLDPARHDPAVEVKGATCTSLRVAPTPEGGWLAQTVVDV
ncbi:MAG: archease [Synechococcaceae cyanobacterium]|nr:archease [Synechococcaceae cyanobacterium]